MGLGDIDAFPLYRAYSQRLQLLYGGSYKLWGEADVVGLLDHYPQFRKMWDQFPHSFYKVDFAKLMILHSWSTPSLYVDLDEYAVARVPWPVPGIIHGVQREDGKPNNNILHYRTRMIYWSS